jgi:hypothetical protein
MSERLTGVVEYVKVGELVDTWDYGMVQVREDATGISWLYVIWFQLTERASAFDRILQGAQLSLVREAVGAGRKVELTIDPDTTNQITEVKLLGGP